jgi:hypothetical protein
MNPDVEQMARLWNVAGLSMGQIGSHFGMSRGKVAGIIRDHRKMFKRRNTLNGEVKVQSTQPQSANKRRAAFHAVKTQAEAEPAPRANCEAISQAEAMAYDVSRLPHAKGLMDLTTCVCRWPLTADGPHLFCCAEVVTGSPYCEHHKIRSRGPGTKSERRAVKDARRAA